MTDLVFNRVMVSVAMSAFLQLPTVLPLWTLASVARSSTANAAGLWLIGLFMDGPARLGLPVRRVLGFLLAIFAVGADPWPVQLEDNFLQGAAVASLPRASLGVASGLWLIGSLVES